MRHCNSVFSATDIWYLLDTDKHLNRRLYLANCPICNKKIALYSYCDLSKINYFEQYFYSGGVDRVKQKFKKEVTSTMLGLRTKYKTPSGFKYGKNVEIRKEGQIVAIKQFACDFFGNKVLIKKITNDDK